MSTHIEWVRRAVGDAPGKTWNPTTGCDQVSPGCGLPLPGAEDEPHEVCYALTLAARLKAMGQVAYQADGDPRTSGPGFAITMHEDRLGLPLRWRTPTTVFVNSMSDLFHPWVTEEFIARVFAVMAATPEHTYQVLTKRAPRMASLVGRGTWGTAGFADAVERAMAEFTHADPRAWPLPNVYLGVSVEDQQRADERIWRLYRTPAAVRFLSCEPLLGPVDLGMDHDCGDPPHLHCPTKPDWVIVGGASGRGARRMDPDWARDLRDQCRTAGVPYFFKQAGAALAREWGCSDRKGGKLEEIPADLRIREYPAAARSAA